jgi:hypothetical protein
MEVTAARLEFLASLIRSLIASLLGQKGPRLLCISLSGSCLFPTFFDTQGE